MDYTSPGGDGTVAAARRLKRWLREHRPYALILPEQYHGLVEDILKKVDRSVEFDPAALMKEWDEKGGIHEYYDYKRRQLERPVIVAVSLPSVLTRLLSH